MMMGDKVSAKEAEKLGMIYKVFSAETFMEEAEKIAETLSQMPTHGLALTKKALNASMQNNLEDQLALESKCQIEAAQTHDYNEGVNAFIEKRKPTFIGK